MGLPGWGGHVPASGSEAWSRAHRRRPIRCYARATACPVLRYGMLLPGEVVLRARLGERAV
eukprot:1613748-Rhodomonas_salina.2